MGNSDSALNHKASYYSVEYLEKSRDEYEDDQATCKGLDLEDEIYSNRHFENVSENEDDFSYNTSKEINKFLTENSRKIESRFDELSMELNQLTASKGISLAGELRNISNQCHHSDTLDSSDYDFLDNYESKSLDGFLTESSASPVDKSAKSCSNLNNLTNVSSIASNLNDLNTTNDENYNHKALVQRSKSYVRPENRVLPNELPTKPLRPTNMLKFDGFKQTWRNNNKNKSLKTIEENEFVKKPTEKQQANRRPSIITKVSLKNPYESIQDYSYLNISQTRTSTNKDNLKKQTQTNNQSSIKYEVKSKNLNFNDELSDNEQINSQTSRNIEPKPLKTQQNCSSFKQISKQTQKNNIPSGKKDKIINDFNDLLAKKEKQDQNNHLKIQLNSKNIQMPTEKTETKIAKNSQMNLKEKEEEEEEEENEYDSLAPNSLLEEMRDIRVEKEPDAGLETKKKVSKSKSFLNQLISYRSSIYNKNKENLEKITKKLKPINLSDESSNKKMPKRSKSIFNQPPKSSNQLANSNVSYAGSDYLDKNHFNLVNDSSSSQRSDLLKNDIQIISRFPINSKVYRHYISGNGIQRDKFVSVVDVSNGLVNDKKPSEKNKVKINTSTYRKCTNNNNKNKTIITNQREADQKEEELYDSIKSNYNYGSFAYTSPSISSFDNISKKNYESPSSTNSVSSSSSMTPPLSSSCFHITNNDMTQVTNKFSNDIQYIYESGTSCISGLTASSLMQTSSNRSESFMTQSNNHKDVDFLAEKNERKNANSINPIKPNMLRKRHSFNDLLDMSRDPYEITYQSNNYSSNDLHLEYELDSYLERDIRKINEEEEIEYQENDKNSLRSSTYNSVRGAFKKLRNSKTNETNKLNNIIFSLIDINSYEDERIANRRAKSTYRIDHLSSGVNKLNQPWNEENQQNRENKPQNSRNVEFDRLIQLFKIKEAQKQPKIENYLNNDVLISAKKRNDSNFFFKTKEQQQQQTERNFDEKSIVKRLPETVDEEKIRNKNSSKTYYGSRERPSILDVFPELKTQKNILERPNKKM
jgi:hypothetical protein